MACNQSTLSVVSTRKALSDLLVFLSAIALLISVLLDGAKLSDWIHAHKSKEHDVTNAPEIAVRREDAGVNGSRCEVKDKQWLIGKCETAKRSPEGVRQFENIMIEWKQAVQDFEDHMKPLTCELEVHHPPRETSQA